MPDLPTSTTGLLAVLRGSGARLYRGVRVYAGALIALVLMLIYLTATQPFFLTSDNVFNVLSGNSALILTSIGLTFIVIAAGFDLSLGAIFAASGYVAYRTLEAGAPAPVALLCGALIGVVLGGVVNGILIGTLRLNFFVVTLGTTSLFGGALKVVTNGQTSSIDADPGSLMYFLGNGEIAGVPFPVILCLVFVLLAAYVLRMTSFGRAVYAVGGNREAARLSGINVTIVLVVVYGIAGFTAAVAGLVDASRLGAASPTAGSTLALTAGAAVLLGGTSFFGGIGGVAGTVVGALLIAFLQNGLGLLEVSSFWQDVVTGGVLVAAVIIDKIQTQRQ